MEASFSKRSLINIIDNPTDKEIVRELCLAVLAQGKNSFQKRWYSRHTISENQVYCGLLARSRFFFKILYFLQ